MMAGLFLIYALAIISILAKQRNLAMVLIVIGIILSILMFWHHVTDTINIRL